MSAFTSKSVLITGASEGIGRALAKRFAATGAKLALAARNRERLETLVAECKAAGAADAVALVADVTKADDCRSIVERTVREFGALDVLVNNAGITMWAQFEELKDPTLIGKLIDVNFLSVAYCTHFALPHLKKSEGRLVAVSSLAGLIGVPGHAIYGASKHAIHGFMNSLRIELEPQKVSCTIVAPDFVVTEIHDRGLRGDGTPMRKRLDARRFMSADACAQLMLTAIERRDRLLLTSVRGRLAALARDLIPGRLLDRIAAIQARKSALTHD